MYAERLGVDRAVAMNPYATLAAAGVRLAFGSDAPVTRLDPWGGVRAARHRVEHVEMPSPEVVATFARLGVVASVQPAFDRLWGGESGMYAQRLGLPRALALNPFAAMRAAGVVLALGSDSPVTPVDPWGSVLAAVRHHTPGSGLSMADAFEAHTRGGWLAAKRDADGVLTAGAPATFAVWDLPEGGQGSVVDGLPTPDTIESVGAAGPACLRTVVRGRQVHSAP
jgi:predicted amidohydrolase YtcJ